MAGLDQRHRCITADVTGAAGEQDIYRLLTLLAGDGPIPQGCFSIELLIAFGYGHCCEA